LSQNYLVDGYNVIHLIPDLKRLVSYDLERARHGLLQRMASFMAGRKGSMTVVFDGDGPNMHQSASYHKIKVRFSSAPEKADPLIKRMIDKQEGKKSLTVISSDQAIFRYARLSGVSALTSHDFLQNISTPSGSGKSAATHIETKYERPLSEDEVDEWMTLFKNGTQDDESD